ncbi:MAG: rod shape-determining protein MreC [Thermoleophilales bacterium]|jgi:rod shape-determining protein MreC|nr:rod shape-determining protein MreC [Thermoleophilales bacterium]
MYDRKVVRRRRAALGVLVGLSIALLTMYFGEGPSGLLHGLQRGAQQVLQPVETGVSRATKPFRDLVGWVGDNVSAKGQNDKLKRENADLRQQVARAQAAEDENRKLRGIVGLPQNPGYPNGVKALTARVIGRSPTVWYEAVQIDKGSSDGVRVDQPVVTNGGLAGRVTSVTGGTATITLIVDASSGVSALVLPDGKPGVVRPKVGNPSDMRLEYLDKKTKVKQGDMVITAGSTDKQLASLFPKGIPIGRVKHVDPNELDVYERVHIEPFADFQRMEFVQVLRANPQPNTDQVPNGISGQGAQAP